MSELATHPGVTTDLTIDADQTFWSEKQVAALRQLGVTNASPADLAVFFHQAVRTGLDPFARQIYMIERQGKQTIQTGIDGFRLIARRATDAARSTLGFMPTEWCGRDGVWRDVWLAREAPAAARVTVLRDGQPYPGLALYDEYVATKRDGGPNSMWASKPALMLAKCAEALALRRAFPQDLSGIYTSDEMGQAHAAPHADVVVPGADPVVETLQAPPAPPEMSAEEFTQETAEKVMDCDTTGDLELLVRKTFPTAAGRYSWAAQFESPWQLAQAQQVRVDTAHGEWAGTLFDLFRMAKDALEAAEAKGAPDPVAAEVQKIADALPDDPWAGDTLVQSVTTLPDTDDRERRSDEGLSNPPAAGTAKAAAKAAAHAASERARSEREAEQAAQAARVNEGAAKA